MSEFKHGLLMENGEIHLRRFDFWAIQEHQRKSSSVDKAVRDLVFGQNGSITAKDGLERVKMLRADLIDELNWYEDLFERFLVVTPEWLDEHLGK